MKIIFQIFLFLISVSLYSQDLNLTDSINGAYYLLEAERGVKNKLFEFGEQNGAKLLLIAACTQCVPAAYTYQKEASEELDRGVFYNATGLYLFQYDDESFVMIMINPKAKNWTDFYFSNFYSKSNSKVAAMNTEKIKDFIISISSKGIGRITVKKKQKNEVNQTG